MARTFHPTGHQRFQVVVFLKLLRDCGYPDIEALEVDMCRGFPLLGELRHTRLASRRPRSDDTYGRPISKETFARLNDAYVRDRMQRDRLDPEWRHMLHEVLQEVASGRMEGPFQGPERWPRKTVGLLLGDCFVARVVQTGADGQRKVRRCEDYRRSHHNSTISVRDRPGVYVETIRRARRLGMDPQVWCQDLSDAYRSYPVQEPGQDGDTWRCHSAAVLQYGTLTASRMPPAGSADVCCSS